MLCRIASTQEQRGRQACAGRRSDIRKSILREANVVCTTLGACKDVEECYHTVVIDEAAQSTEPGALVPIAYGCRRCILVGDPQQLTATVLSRAAAKKRYAPANTVNSDFTSSSPSPEEWTTSHCHPPNIQFPAVCGQPDKQTNEAFSLETPKNCAPAEVATGNLTPALRRPPPPPPRPLAQARPCLNTADTI